MKRSAEFTLSERPKGADKLAYSIRTVAFYSRDKGGNSARNFRKLVTGKKSVHGALPDLLFRYTYAIRRAALFTGFASDMLENGNEQDRTVCGIPTSISVDLKRAFVRPAFLMLVASVRCQLALWLVRSRR